MESLKNSLQLLSTDRKESLGGKLNHGVDYLQLSELILIFPRPPLQFFRFVLGIGGIIDCTAEHVEHAAIHMGTDLRDQPPVHFLGVLSSQVGY